MSGGGPGEPARASGAPWVLVLDVGSSSVRVWFFDRSGQGVDPGPDAQREYRWTTEPTGAMECDAEPLVGHCVRAVDAALAHARGAGLEIGAVAVAAFWHSVLGADGDGAPRTPVYGWGDTRAAPDAVRLRDRVEEASIHGRTGCFIHPSYPAVKLLWLRRTRPEAFGAVERWVSFPEYLERRLFGRWRCSVSMASGSGLLDVHALRWDAEWLDRLGISERQLSPLVDVGAPARGLLDPFAHRWPELAEVPWFPALGDGACANVGSGAVGSGQLAVTVGTSAAVRALWEAEEVRVPEGIWCYRLDGRRWVAGRALSNGGNGIAFLRDLLRLPSEREWEAELLAMEPAEHGLTVLPFLVGERGPGWLHQTRAGILGLTPSTRPEQVVRAWMEAVAYHIADGLERLEAVAGPAEVVRGSGGALHASPIWAQILADVLGRPVALPAEPEATSRGAALVALEQLGLIPDLLTAPVHEAARYRPDPVRAGSYRTARARHLALEAALRPWMPTLASASPPTGEDRLDP